MRYYTALTTIAVTLVLTSGSWAQERGRNTEEPPGGRNDEQMWVMNKKMLTDMTLTHYNDMLGFAKVIMSNTVINSNQQNANATNWSNAVAGIGREASIFQAATAAAGQGRQLTNADTSQNRQNTASDVAMGQAYQNATFMNQLAAMIEAKLAEAVVPIITEALRNPPAGMSSTGRPPVNQDGQ